MIFSVVKKWIADNKKYFQYAIYSAKANLKSEVAESYLSWLWWILDPLLFMLVYVFIAQVVFNRSGLYFPVFVIIGLTIWTFFNKTTTQSVKLMKNNKNIIKKIYLPKHILLLQTLLINAFKMCISFALVFGLMICYKVPISYHMIYTLPHIIMIGILSYGIGCIWLHLGVFIEDLQNVTTIGLRLLFYLSGVFYDISNSIPQPYNRWLLVGNPIAFAMNGCRNALLYQTGPEWKYVIFWSVVGIILSYMGVTAIYKHENSYGKVL